MAARQRDADAWIVRSLPLLPPLLALAVAAHAGRLAWQRREGGPVEIALRAAETQPAEEEIHWRRALDLRPRTWEALLGLAWRAESEGREREARQLYEQAYRANRMFRVAWARLNFLARSGHPTEFWPAAREAFRMSHRDRRALFDLCWRMQPDGEFLVREVIGIRPPVLFDAAQFLMSRDRPAARLAYARLLEQPYLSLAETNAGRVATEDERRGLGLDLCDLELDLGNRPEAWAIWQRMGRHGLLREATGRGFDWRKGKATGVAATPAGAHWVLAFSGEQDSNSVVLWRHAEDGAAPAPLPAELRQHREGERVMLTAKRGFRGVVTVAPGGIAP